MAVEGCAALAVAGPRAGLTEASPPGGAVFLLSSCPLPGLEEFFCVSILSFKKVFKNSYLTN